MDLQTVSGDLTLQDMQGTLRVKTISGAVRITAFAGDLHLQTVSGQVNVGASRLHSLQGTTVSGDVRLGGHLEGGPYRMESVSADFTLDPPPEASLHLRLETLSGQLIIPAPLAAHRPRPGWQEARILGGRVEVHLTSISGDLRLPSSGTSAGDDQATGERLDMLDKIKKGELSVDEALESLSD